LINRRFQVGWKRKATMRGFISYIFAAIMVVVVLDAVVPPVGRGLAIAVRLEDDRADQIVDRTHKGDRLQVPRASGRRMLPMRAPAVLIGCEPVFSSLSAGSQANFAGRCVS
jgi:hypothetical protein